MERLSGPDVDARLEALVAAEDLELARQGIAVVYPYREAKEQQHEEPSTERYEYQASCEEYDPQPETDSSATETDRSDSPKSPGWWKNLRVVTEPGNVVTETGCCNSPKKSFGK